MCSCDHLSRLQREGVNRHLIAWTLCDKLDGFQSGWMTEAWSSQSNSGVVVFVVT